ncbi:MAG: hypothetical protein ACRDNK_15710 [Solirubrobacteraceae bacterium]
MTATPEALRDHYRLIGQVEEIRVRSGDRRPPKFVKRRARCTGRHADATCRGCFEHIESGTKMVWREDVNCYVAARRDYYWHPHCDPDYVNREWSKLRNRFLRDGWAIPA